MQQIACHKCLKTWEFEPPLGRRDQCPHCGADARVCLNCQRYDRNAYRQCREPQAEWVQDKVSGNFCGYLSPKAEPTGRDSEAGVAKDKLDQLFSGSKLLEEPKPTLGFAAELEKFLQKKK